jgi:uncharacterized membrane protein YdcZ (DUF606 family)
MSLRPRRGNLVIWSSSDRQSWAWRPARSPRIRWWLRTGALLALMGLVRLARSTRTRWEAICLVAGATITVIGYEVRAASVAFLVGILVLVVTLLKGIATKGRAAGQAADCWQWHG